MRAGRRRAPAAVGRALQEAGIAWLEDPVHHLDVAGSRRPPASARGADRGRRAPLSPGRLSHAPGGARRRRAHSRPGPGGGVTPWRKIAALAQAHRVVVCGHVVPEIQVHLLASIPNGHMVEYVPRSAGILTSMPRIEGGELWRRTGPAWVSSSTTRPCDATGSRSSWSRPARSAARGRALRRSEWRRPRRARCGPVGHGRPRCRALTRSRAASSLTCARSSVSRAWSSPSPRCRSPAASTPRSTPFACAARRPPSRGRSCSACCARTTIPRW